MELESSLWALAGMGALLTIIGTLIVVLLAWLHVRLGKHEKRIEEIYRHLDDQYVRKETHAAQLQTAMQASESQQRLLLDAINGQNARLDKVVEKLAHRAPSQ